MVQMKHINVVKLLQVIRERDQIYLVLEHCDCSLFQCMQGLKNKGQTLAEDQIRWAMQGMLAALGYIHVRSTFLSLCLFTY